MQHKETTSIDRSNAVRKSPLICFSSSPAERFAAPRRLIPRRRRLALIILAGGVAAAVGFAAKPRVDPDRTWADAERAFLAGNWPQARSLLRKIERVRTKNALDWVLESQLDTAEGHFAQAFAALARVPDSHPIAPQAHLLAGRLHRQLHCVRKAEGEFRRALELKPALIEARKELIYVLGVQSRRREIDAEFHELARSTLLTHHDLFTWALTHFTHWNPDIVADLDSFIKADPEDRSSRLAVVELILDRPDVESYIKRVLEPLPNSDLDALALRITLAFNLGRIDEAERLLSLASDHKHPRIARIRGEIALRQRDLDLAIKYFQEARSAEPYDRVSPMQLAQAYQLKGEKAAADGILDAVKRLNRVYNLIIRIKSPTAANQISDLAELGDAFEQAGLCEEAKGWYRLAVIIDPLDSNAQRGLYRLQQGRSS